MLGVFALGWRPRCPTQWLSSSIAMKRTFGGDLSAAERAHGADSPERRDEETENEIEDSFTIEASYPPA